ncbi:hypothetical protein [Nonomuraea cypriaca]|uniref:hypothetical protein n=1 Tax=Nonomuraea cypriaca TaxID=1187855 RepID=UPI0038B35E6A
MDTLGLLLCVMVTAASVQDRPTELALSEIWRAYLARFDEEHTFTFSKGALGLIIAKLRTPEQTDRWVRLIMAALTQLALARPLVEDLRRPWEKPPAPDRHLRLVGMCG